MDYNRLNFRIFISGLMILLASGAAYADQWKTTRQFVVTETDSVAREKQPVTAEFTVGETSSEKLLRGVFLFEGAAESGKETVCQVHGIRQVNNGTRFRVTFITSLKKGERKVFTLAFDGSRQRSLEQAQSSDWVRGGGLETVVENEYYRLTTSEITGGAVQDLINKVGSGKTLEAHLGPIDWSPSVAAPVHPDSSSGTFWMGAHYCKWYTPPTYSVESGPIFYEVERKGYLPVQFHSADEIHPVPHLDNKLHVTLTYRFYRDLPYFICERLLSIDEDFPLWLLRHNQWVFRKGLFTHAFYKNHSTDINPELDDDEIGYMSFEGDDRIILDHHTLGSTLPENIPWLAFANINDGDGLADIRLEFNAWNAFDPGRPPVFYHPRTYLPDHQGVNYWFKSISYVYTYRSNAGPGFLVTIPAGSRYYERQANLVYRYVHPGNYTERKLDRWDESWVRVLAKDPRLYFDSRNSIFPVEKYNWLLKHPPAVEYLAD